MIGLFSLPTQNTIDDSFCQGPYFFFYFLKLVFILYTYLSLAPSGNCSMNAFEGGWKDNLWDFSSWYVAIKLRKSKIRKAVLYWHVQIKVFLPLYLLEE